MPNARGPRWWGRLIRLHRYLGVGFCLLFLAWFASGIVMVYRRMPSLGTADRLAGLAPIAIDRLRVTPDSAWRVVGRGSPSAVRLAMLLDRPVYRFLDQDRWIAAYADDGAAVGPVDSASVMRVAGALAGGAAVRYLGLEAGPDQWTLSSPIRHLGPLHHFAVDDGRGTELYVTEATGEAVMRTDRASRFWGYVGPVTHWFFFRPLRIHTPVWSALVVYGSLIGTWLCLSGIVVGLYRARFRRRYRGNRMSPHHGWLKWHHQAGLAFGVLTFTWIFSGMLSMSPWNWSPGSSPTADDLHGAAGRLDLAGLRLRPAEVLRSVSPWSPRELELVSLLGRPYYRVVLPPPGEPTGPWENTDRPAYVGAGPAWPLRILAADTIGVGAVSAFDRPTLERAAAAARPGQPVLASDWLERFDSYYYHHRAAGLPLPVLRIKYADGAWLYFDPRSGLPVLHHTAVSRAERWLYHGLHSLDFPGLYQAGVLWDLTVVAGSVGGLLVSLTALVIGWRRIIPRRAARRR